MRILVLHNARSGTGKRQQLVRALVSDLTAGGHQIEELEVGPGCTGEIVTDRLSNADLVVICGGDGTVHHALPSLMQTATPMYHFPLGTENLFSREFGMTRESHTLRAAIVRWEIRRMDLASVNGRVFALMASIGFDACVVQRVAAARTRGVSRFDYVRAAVAELGSPRVPTLTISVDGQHLISREPGLAIVANSRQYAARLDPARHADMADGLLDVVFLPHTGRLGIARSMASIMAGTHLEHMFSRHATGGQIVIECDDDAPLQIDGEAAGSGRLFRFSILPGVLHVLVPPHSAGR